MWSIGILAGCLATCTCRMHCIWQIGRPGRPFGTVWRKAALRILSGTTVTGKNFLLPSPVLYRVDIPAFYKVTAKAWALKAMEPVWICWLPIIVRKALKKCENKDFTIQNIGNLFCFFL
ncbi:hypothetical protein EVA_16713 [gut metagenome]|uniref:Uncharacterized protein n=1 Tax=gut metagenome TaxID=749906 RepID=J9FJV3_9ZZZZ